MAGDATRPVTRHGDPGGREAHDSTDGNDRRQRQWREATAHDATLTEPTDAPSFRPTTSGELHTHDDIPTAHPMTTTDTTREPERIAAADDHDRRQPRRGPPPTKGASRRRGNKHHIHRHIDTGAPSLRPTTSDDLHAHDDRPTAHPMATTDMTREPERIATTDDHDGRQRRRTTTHTTDSSRRRNNTHHAHRHIDHSQHGHHDLDHDHDGHRDRDIAPGASRPPPTPPPPSTPMTRPQRQPRGDLDLDRVRLGTTTTSRTTETARTRMQRTARDGGTTTTDTPPATPLTGPAEPPSGKAHSDTQGSPAGMGYVATAFLHLLATTRRPARMQQHYKTHHPRTTATQRHGRTDRRARP